MNDKLEQLKESILILVKSIAKNQDEVELHTEEKYSEEKGDFTMINIKVATPDIPVCIGSGGTTAESIRRLACLFARRLDYDKRLFVRIDAPTMPRNHFKEF